MGGAKRAVAAWMAAALLLRGEVRAADATTEPVRVDVTKREQVEAAVGGTAVVAFGVVESAQWAAKVLTVRFKGGNDFRVVAGERQRAALDKAFGTDVTMTIAGRAIEVTGNVVRYAGKDKRRAGTVEILVTKPGQIKVNP